MSLFKGMNTMFENKAAMEMATDDLLFEEAMALEAEDKYDLAVDDDAEINKLVDEDEKDDALDEEVNAPDNTIGAVSNNEDEAKPMKSEKQAPANESFLSSLIAMEGKSKEKNSDGDNNGKCAKCGGDPDKCGCTEEEKKGKSSKKDDQKSDDEGKCPKCGKDPCECDDDNKKKKTKKSGDGDDEDNDGDAAEECGSIGCESAALTGAAFLKSLVMDTNDPIKTKPGSVGLTSSAADFKDNNTDAASDNNDPIKTEPGSVGPEDSAADFDGNFHDEYDDDTDPIKTKPGSVSTPATAKDPASESFLSGLVGGISMESEMPDDVFDAQNQEGESEGSDSNSMESGASDIGIEAMDTNAINDLIHNGDYDAAIESIQAYEKSIKEATESATLTDAQQASAAHMIATTEALTLATCADKMIHARLDQGEAMESAVKRVLSQFNAKKEQMAEAGTLTPVIESSIDKVTGYYNIQLAMESSDPEETSDGSVGQGDSEASGDGNFSGGELNKSEIERADDNPAGSDGSAEFDDNVSGGEDDDNDPVHTDDGSVGQKDSTAKDPASEGFGFGYSSDWDPANEAEAVLSELEALTASMDDEIDQMDNPFDE